MLNTVSCFHWLFCPTVWASFHIKMSGVSTLFVSANALPAVTSPDFIGGLEICRAMEKVVGVGNVDGSIRISGLWRLQVKNEKSRTVLLTQGISIRGLNITVLSKNPYLVDNQESVKLIVGNLPFSISNEEIKQALISNGAKAVFFLSSSESNFLTRILIS